MKSVLNGVRANSNHSAVVCFSVFMRGLFFLVAYGCDAFNFNPRAERKAVCPQSAPGRIRLREKGSANAKAYREPDLLAIRCTHWLCDFFVSIFFISYVE